MENIISPLSPYIRVGGKKVNFYLPVNRNLTSPSLPQKDTHISALKTVKSYSVPFLAPQKLSSCSSLTPGLRQLRVSTMAHGSLGLSLYRTGVSRKSSCGCLPGDTSLGFLFAPASHRSAELPFEVPRFPVASQLPKSHVPTAEQSGQPSPLSCSYCDQIPSKALWSGRGLCGSGACV